jgi:hypothetical protein
VKVAVCATLTGHHPTFREPSGSAALDVPFAVERELRRKGGTDLITLGRLDGPSARDEPFSEPHFYAQ